MTQNSKSGASSGKRQSKPSGPSISGSGAGKAGGAVGITLGFDPVFDEIILGVGDGNNPESREHSPELAELFRKMHEEWLETTPGAHLDDDAYQRWQDEEFVRRMREMDYVKRPDKKPPPEE